MGGDAVNDEAVAETIEIAGDPLDAEFRRSLPGVGGFTCQEQREIAHAYYSGNPPNVLGILPTGKGKSLCHMLPTYLWRKERRTGLTVVVSPILALMQDQVDALESDRNVYGKLELWAEQLNSTVTAERRRTIRKQLANGTVNVLYLGPEAFVQPWNYEALITAATNGHLRGLVIDEAHMVAEWGDEFRTCFKRMGPVRELLQRAMPKGDILRTLVLTATLPKASREEVLGSLGIVDRVTTFERKEIRTEHVLSVARLKNHEEKLKQLVPDVRRLKKVGPGIIYCNQRAHCVEIVKLLNRRKLGPAEWYHGGTSARARRDILQRFRSSADLVIVATDAFGLGVDKPDVRWVLHFAQPDSIDQYYQEIGRGGRDGRPCEALLYYAPSDKGQATRNSLKRLTTEKFNERLTSMKSGAIRINLPGRPLALLEEETIPGYVKDRVEKARDPRSVAFHAEWNHAVLVRAEQLGWLRLGPDTVVEFECRLGPRAEKSKLKERAPGLAAAGLLEGLTQWQPVRLDIGRAARSLNVDPLSLQRELFSLVQDGWIRPEITSGTSWMKTRVLVTHLASHSRRLKEDVAHRDGRQRRGVQRVNDMARYARATDCRRSYFYRAYEYELPTTGCGICDNCKKPRLERRSK